MNVAQLWSWLLKICSGTCGSVPSATPKLTVTIKTKWTGYKHMFKDKHEFMSWAMEYAMIVEREYAIPHLITITNACHESGNGNSKLSTNDFNFFGMTANEDWMKKQKPFSNYTTTEFHKLPPEKIQWWNRPGDILTKESDGKGGSILKVLVPFRKYEKPLDSFQDWAYKIKTNYPKAYQFALKNEVKGFYDAVQEGGYATDTAYSEKLLALYHKFREIETEVV